MLRFSTPAGDGWLERVWCCGGAGVVDTLLGPEATGPSHALRGVWWLLFRLVALLLEGVPGWVCWMGVWGCCLRTA